MTARRGTRLALIGALALAAAPRPAAAGYDDDHDGHAAIHPNQRWTRGLYLNGGGGSVAGIDGGGFGLSLEVARGRGRWQLFGDAMARWTSLAIGAPRDPVTMMPIRPDIDGPTGLDMRLGFGARVIAASFEPDSSAGLEMYVEGGAGLSRIWWNGGGTLTRPDVALGAGLQVRSFQTPHLTLRFGVKVLVQPPVDDPMTVICHGTCPTSGQSEGDSAFVAQFGVGW